MQYWRGEINEMSELDKMKTDLTKHVANITAPESTRWHRNYTDRADWFWLWSADLVDE